MTFLVFAPGIQGTELYERKPKRGQCDRIWPPRLFECPHRFSVPTSWLARTSLVPKQPIDEIDGCVDVYEPIDEVLAAAGYRDCFSHPGAEHRKLAFGYDWRADLWTSANDLADRLDRIRFYPDEELILLGHSMGGLVCRLLLESGAFSARAWFVRIRRFYALSTPHLGTLEVLAKHLGLRPMAAADGDPRLIFDQPAFPAGYQLLPPPSFFAAGAEPIVTDRNGRAVDIYSRAGAGLLDFNRDNLEAAREFWSRLCLARRPPNIAYRILSGSSTHTVQKIAANGSGWRAVETIQGDGAVPDWSLRPPGVRATLFPGEHLAFLRRHRLRRALGKQLSARPEAFALPERRASRLDLETDARGYFPGQPIHAALFIEDTTTADGAELVIERIDVAASTKSAVPAFRHNAMSVRTMAAQTMAVRNRARRALRAPDQPGAYRLTLRLRGRRIAVSTPFVVSNRA